MSTYPDYSGLPDYGRRTLAPSRPAYRPWSTALVATVIGLVISLVVGFVAGFLGLAWAVSGSAPDASLQKVLVVMMAFTLVLNLLVVWIQSGIVRRRGGARPLLSCFAGAVAGFLAGQAVGLVDGGWLAWPISIAAQVATIALLSAQE